MTTNRDGGGYAYVQEEIQGKGEKWGDNHEHDRYPSPEPEPHFLDKEDDDKAPKQKGAEELYGHDEQEDADDASHASPTFEPVKDRFL